ncbi:MAG TPA: diguanylate cyclase [bacterium]|nr:diguanylate cyclase [bacterium]
MTGRLIAIRSARGREIAPLVVVFLVYVVAAKLALRLAIVNPSATPVWPPTGIAIASLLLLGVRVWPAVFAGAFLVNVTTAGTVWTSLGIASGNALEAALAARLITVYAGGVNAFERPRHIFAFAALAAAVSPAVSASVGSTSLALGGFAPWADYPRVWLTWYLGDATGALIVAPLLILWGLDRSVRWSRDEARERVAFTLLLVAAGWMVFGGVFSLEFLTVPFFVWAAFRFGCRDTATVIAALSAMAVWGAIRGAGPFAGATPNESLLLVQAFMAVMAIVALPLASVVSERQRLYTLVEREAMRAGRLRDVTLETLNAIVSSAMSSSDLPTLLESTVDLALKALGCERGGIWAGGVEVFRGVPREVGESMLHAAQSSGRELRAPVAVQDWQDRPAPGADDLVPVMTRFDTRASLTAPIQTNGRCIGGVAVLSASPRMWLSDEAMLVEAIGKQIGEVVERLQLVQTTQQRTAELEAFYDLSRELRKARSVEQMYPMIVGHALGLLAADHGALVLVGPDRKTLVHAHTAGMEAQEPGSAFPAEGTRSEMVLKTGVAFVTEDFSTEAPPRFFRRDAYRQFGPLVIVPVRSEEENIGTLRLGRRKRPGARPFADAEVRLLEGIAEVAGTAIHRARLHQDLEQSYIEMVLALARAADARDNYTGDHSERIATRAVALARALGRTQAEVQDIHWGALLHDIGKLGVPDSILRKPGPLSEAEWQVMRQHPVIGAEILRPVDRMRNVAILVRHHQERWDGTGYPDGLRGEGIPLGARILAAVDAYSAITDDRAYDRGRTSDAAVAELLRCAGTQFDPRVVEVFCGMVLGGDDQANLPARPALARGGSAIRHPAMEIARSLSYAQQVGRAVPAMTDLARRLLRPLDLAAVLDEILGQIHEVFGYPICAVLFIDERTQELHVKAQRGYDPGVVKDLRLRVGKQGIAGWVADHRRPHYAPDVAKDPLYVAGAPDARSNVAYPLIVDDRVIGVLDVESPAVDAFPKDVRDLLEAFAVLAGLAILRAERDEELNHLALTDGLTGLANRRALWDALERETARATRAGCAVSVVHVEVDKFKQINDSLGHLQGDAILRSVADVLKRNSRAADLVARVGGDEFVLLLADTPKAAAAQIAERVRHHVEKILVLGNPPLTVSVGLASLPEDGGNAEALMDAADRAMYRAKHAGGNGVQVA